MGHATPPALRGLPLLGNLLEYRRDHVDVFWRAYRALGPIFSIRLGPQRAVVLIGPEGNRFFFTQVDKILSLPEVYRFVIPMFGKVLNAADSENTRKQQLALLHSAFQGRKMQHHVEIMVRETSAWLDSLGESGSFELDKEFEALGMNIAASAFMGEAIRTQMSDFLPLYEDLARGMEFVLPPNLPLPRFRRRDQARKKLGEMIRPVIAERQAHPERYDDFLQTIVQGEYLERGEGAEETVIGLALLSVFTAYITTAAQTSWGLIQLLQHPAYLARVEAELEAVLHGEYKHINVDSLSRLERLEWSLKETQRMHPVMSHYARYNTQGYDLGGYHIPGGWLTMVCPAISHRLPGVFTQPDTFDPARFSPARAEDRRYTYGLISFGAGLYRCPGAGFGMNEMKCIVTMLLQRFMLELVDNNPKRNFELGVTRPQPPCLIKYKKRERPKSALPRFAIAGRPEGIPSACPAAFGFHEA